MSKRQEDGKRQMAESKYQIAKDKSAIRNPQSAFGSIPRLAGAVWRSLPRFLRYAILGLVEPKFMVTAGALVFNEQGQLLLLKHVFHVGSGWGVPGGFIEKGEAPEAALRRELQEEIGLAVKDVQLIYVRTLRRPQQVELVFMCCPAGPLGALSGEIERAEWFAPDNLPPDLSENQRHLLQSALPKNGK